MIGACLESLLMEWGLVEKEMSLVDHGGCSVSMSAMAVECDGGVVV